MSCAVAEKICVIRGNTPALMARVEARDAAHASVPVTRANVATILYVVIDIDDNNRESEGGTLNEDDVFYDTLQTGEIWDVDSTGFNFLHELPSAAIDHDSHAFIVEYTVTLNSGAVATWKQPIDGQRRYSSTPS